MKFSGFVPLRRSILERTTSGELSLQEFAALAVLILLADKSTGSGKINGPVLRTYLPGLSGDAAKRVLHSLEEKGAIFREITPRSPLVYAYWVDKYRPTVGPHKMLQLSIAKALITHNLSDIQYVKAAPEGAPATSPEGAPDTPPEGAHYNKKDTDNLIKKENPSLVLGECATRSASSAQRVSTKGRTFGEAGAPQVRHGCASTAPQLPDNCSVTAPQLPPGYELRDGDDGVGVYSPAGIKVSERVVPLLYQERPQ